MHVKLQMYAYHIYHKYHIIHVCVCTHTYLIGTVYRQLLSSFIVCLSSFTNFGIQHFALAALAALHYYLFLPGILDASICVKLGNISPNVLRYKNSFETGHLSRYTVLNVASSGTSCPATESNVAI